MNWFFALTHARMLTQLDSKRKPKLAQVTIVDYHRESIMRKKKNLMPPVHPGEILREDLMKPLGLTVSGLARELKVPSNRLSDTVNGRRSINAEIALRLSRYFGNTPEFWINLQAAYDLRVTIHSSASRIQRELRPHKAA
jgi:addiction module HigA family antidote